MILSAQMHAAVNTAWHNHQLDWEFKKNWTEALRTKHRSLNEEQAQPGTPLPHCIFNAEIPTVEARMTDPTDVGKKRILQQMLWSFEVYAKELDGSSKSSKEHAADLIEKIAATFGGHPEKSPKSVTIATGNLVQFKYLRDYGSRIGDSEYQWNIDYEILVDIPITT